MEPMLTGRNCRQFLSAVATARMQNYSLPNLHGHSFDGGHSLSHVQVTSLASREGVGHGAALASYS